ncbi:MAG: DUF2383 domain-containing protein [Byssovorax sp.]
MQPTTSPKAETTNASVEKLQELLRSEMSAVETYELALKSVTHVGLHRTLQEILVNHSRRIPQLREKIVGMNGEAPTSTGVWGAFAKVFQAGADMLGDRTAIAALEDGEDKSVALYATDMAGVDAKTRKFIENELAPEQNRTHELCRTLKSYMSAPS